MVVSDQSRIHHVAANHTGTRYRRWPIARCLTHFWERTDGGGREGVRMGLHRRRSLSELGEEEEQAAGRLSLSGVPPSISTVRECASIANYLLLLTVY